MRSLFSRPASLPAILHQTTSAMVREMEKDRAITMLSGALAEMTAMERLRERETAEQKEEWEEALMMRGSGPWRLPAKRDPNKQLKESDGGAYGDTELMLNNLEWRRESNMAWLQFSRWGIQQIILLSRLRAIKEPMLQRGINLSALYVFGRGVEITSTDEAAAGVLKDWRERNKAVLGQVALADQERSKYTDGNLFWVCFTDKENSGEVNIRTIDATEILDIISDPDDSATPWYYRRDWTQKVFDPIKGVTRNEQRRAWYPALNYEPADKPGMIGGDPVLWDSPVLHRKCGAPAKWAFGLPLVYAALYPARCVSDFLHDCMTIKKSLAQFSMILTTKGGQQALQGVKQQLSTTAGPPGGIWDTNPPAVTGSIFASGPGTTLEAFDTKGAGGDPGEVREFKLQVAMVFGAPESFWGDMNTSNLATATSLDRPTELGYNEKQEVWREDLVALALYQLRASNGAPSGKLREAKNGASGRLVIREAARKRDGRGRMVYEASVPQTEDEVQVLCNFPAIIEADVPQQVQAIVQAATFGLGKFAGIDEKEAVRLAGDLVGIENNEEVLEEQYPTDGPDAYDPLRIKEEPLPIDPLTGKPMKPAAPVVPKEARIKGALSRLGKALRVYESEDGV